MAVSEQDAVDGFERLSAAGDHSGSGVEQQSFFAPFDEDAVGVGILATSLAEENPGAADLQIFERIGHESGD